MLARRLFQSRFPQPLAVTPLTHRSFSTSTSRARSVIVTGAAQGIGRAIAVQLAEDGYDVCVNDVESKQQALEELCHHLTTHHRRAALPIVADVSSAPSVETMVKTSVSHLGPLNTIVANAGIVRIAPITAISRADHDTIFGVNYFGVHNCYRAATAQFLAQGPPSRDDAEDAEKATDHPPAHTHPESAAKPRKSKGVYKLIGAGSVAGYRAYPNIGAYAASKWAVRGLTQAYALELGGKGITANNYAPGIVGTGMWEKLDKELGAMHGREKGETQAMEARKAVMGRVSVPEDVAGAVSWLAGPGSDFVTGQTVVVDGGTFMT